MKLFHTIFIHPLYISGKKPKHKHAEIGFKKATAAAQSSLKIDVIVLGVRTFFWFAKYNGARTLFIYNVTPLFTYPYLMLHVYTFKLSLSSRRHHVISILKSCKQKFAPLRTFKPTPMPT